MKPGDKIRAYRREHRYTLRDFADLCGLSFAQVRLMENGVNSAGKPSTPSIPSLAKAAASMGITLSELLEGCDDFEVRMVDVPKHKIPDDRQEIIDKIILATPEQFSKIQSYVDFVTKE